MKIGIMQGRLTPPYNERIQFFPWLKWENEFKLACNKIDLIEWTIDDFNIHLNPIFFEQELILNLSKKFKINIESVTCDFLMENPFYKNAKTKINSLYYLERLIDVSKDLKIKYLVFPLVDNGSIENISQENELIKKLSKIEKKLTKNTMILFESDYYPKKLKKFILKFNPNKFGINYDTGNSASLGFDVKQEIDQYYEFIKNIHIKDRLLNSESVKLGNGSFLFEQFFKLIKERLYKGNLILQTARGKNNREMETLDYNLKFLRKLI